jgi:hypothetical protein
MILLAYNANIKEHRWLLEVAICNGNGWTVVWILGSANVQTVDFRTALYNCAPLAHHSSPHQHLVVVCLVRLCLLNRYYCDYYLDDSDCFSHVLMHSNHTKRMLSYYILFIRISYTSGHIGPGLWTVSANALDSLILEQNTEWTVELSNPFFMQRLSYSRRQVTKESSSNIHRNFKWA